MTQAYGTNYPPLLDAPTAVVGISFATSLVGAVMAGASHPVAGLGVLAIGLLSAVGIHHILWLAGDRSLAGTLASAPANDVTVEKTRRTKVYAAKRA